MKKKRTFCTRESIPRIKTKSKIKSFLFTSESTLDKPIREIINIKKTQLSDLEKRISDNSDLIDEKTFCDDKYAIYDQLAEDYFYVDDINDELKALAEIQIIYAYKHFEIQLKKLISTAYDDDSVLKIYRWDNLMNYLKVRNIIPSEIDYYSEVLQLKDVNNTFKHSDNIEKIRYIPEFSKGDDVLCQDLEEFYERVKDTPRKFISCLAETIEEELFNFDFRKLEHLAKPLFHRMDEDTAKQFVEALLKQYK